MCVAQYSVLDIQNSPLVLDSNHMTTFKPSHFTISIKMCVVYMYR